MKHECDSATINIYLQDVQENSFIKVTREFDTQDRTHWKLNGNRCTAAQVQECIKTFNIQVRSEKFFFQTAIILLFNFHLVARNSFIVALIPLLIMLACHFDINLWIYLGVIQVIQNTQSLVFIDHKHFLDDIQQT